MKVGGYAPNSEGPSKTDVHPANSLYILHLNGQKWVGMLRNTVATDRRMV